MRKFTILLTILFAAVLVVGCQTANEEPTAAPIEEAVEAEPVATEEPPPPPTEEPVAEAAAPIVTGVVVPNAAAELPADAVVTMILYGVSRAGATVVSDQAITGAPVFPIPYALAYDESTIDPGFLYTVHADIKDAEGNLLFVSTGLYPVITFDNPTEAVEVMVYPVTAPPPGEETTPGTPPVVTVTLSDDTIAAGSDVDVYTHATATDGAGIVKLELYVDDEMLDEWNSPTPEGEPWIHYTFVGRGVESTGQYEIRVKAIDNQGDEAMSDAEKLTVE